jgi:hypothetical protein
MTARLCRIEGPKLKVQVTLLGSPRSFMAKSSNFSGLRRKTVVMAEILFGIFWSLTLTMIGNQASLRDAAPFTPQTVG